MGQSQTHTYKTKKKVNDIIKKINKMETAGHVYSKKARQQIKQGTHRVAITGRQKK